MDRDLSPQQRRARWLPLARGLLVAVALVAVLGWSGQRYLRPSLDRSDLRIAAVERGPIEAIVSATGTVVPLVEQTISSPISAEIRKVLVSLGQSVEPGQIIMKLDTTASALELSNLEQQLALEKAELRSSDLQLADVIRQSRSRGDLLAIDRQSREVRLDRFERLAGTGIVSAEELLTAQLDLKRTQIEIEQVDAEVVSLEARREAELERLRLEYSILEGQTAAQARRVALASVTAPRAGVVTQLVQQQGASVVEGQALAIIAAQSSFSVEATLSDFYSSQLKPGQRAKVRSAYDEIGGRLARILPSPDGPGLVLFIDLDDPAAPNLRADLRVDVEIVTAEKADVLQVRRGPGLDSAGIQQVYVLDGDRAVRTAVRTGMSSRRSIEIVDGVRLGDEVVISDMTAYEPLSEIRIR